jgi:mono/diheme cytochrome c family protein
MSNQTTPAGNAAPDHRRGGSRRIGRLGAALAALSAASAGAVWLGARAYDVGVTTPHSMPIEWVMRRGMETSIRSHAENVVIPPGTDLQDAQLAERAIGHYSVACAQCHGAPGHPAAPWMVLYPPPADLTRADVVSRWSDAELYWIIKNGIKDTGMIALGPTHQEHDLWAVSAFVRQLPKTSSDRYHELVTQYHAQQAAKSTASAHQH